MGEEYASKNNHRWMNILWEFLEVLFGLLQFSQQVGKKTSTSKKTEEHPPVNYK